MMTRNKAAEYLGVKPQTITNWCKNGLLGYCYGEHRMLYVNRDDVEKYRQKYKAIAVNEKMLDAKLKELKEERLRFDEELVQLRHMIVQSKNGISTGKEVGNLIACLYEHLMIPGMRQREAEIIELFIADGLRFSELSEKYNLTRDRIRQILEKGCRRVTENIEGIIESVNDVKNMRIKLKDEERGINELRAELERNYAKGEKIKLKKKAEQARDSILPFLFKNLSEFNFHTRTRNIFRYHKPPIETVYDLLASVSNVEELKRERNCGKKTLEQIQDFVDREKLFFKDPNETDDEFIIRLAETLTKSWDKSSDNSQGVVAPGMQV